MQFQMKTKKLGDGIKYAEDAKDIFICGFNLFRLYRKTVNRRISEDI